MRLGIDLDGVVANFTQGWMDFYNREFGSDLTFEDSRNWGDLVDLTHFHDIDEFWDWAEHLDGHSIFWHLDPYPGAVESVRGLAGNGHEIVILTTKPSFAHDDTHEWVERHRIPTREIHIFEGNDKWHVECDVYLDDGPYVIPGLIEHRPDKTVCRYIRPWNWAVDGAVDVRDFTEFHDVVSGLDQSA